MIHHPSQLGNFTTRIPDGDNRDRLVCDNCGLIHYDNPRIVVGALVTAGWLLLVMGLDMVAGHVPSRRRAVWTALAFVVAFLSPVLPAAALRVAGS